MMGSSPHIGGVSMNRAEFMKILRGSKQYEFVSDTRLEIIGYYTGKRVTLDLGELTEEMLEDIIVEDEEEDD